MKKRLFYCFQPMALETAEEEQISHGIIGQKEDSKNSLKISGQRNNPKRSFSQKIKISACRSIHRLSPQWKYDSLRKVDSHLKVSDVDDEDEDDDIRLVEGVEFYNMQETEITSLKSTTSSITEGKSLPLDENIIRSKASYTKINPGLYLFVITLFFTVVWGRVAAILFTLVFSYLFRLAFSR